MAAPVAIATAAPDAISPGKGHPARARPRSCSRTGAGAVSAARRANPSMAELANRGRSAGEPRSSAKPGRTPGPAVPAGVAAAGRWSRSRRRTAAGVQRCSDTGPPCGAVTLAACVSLGGSQSSIPLESLSARLRYPLAEVGIELEGQPGGREPDDPPLAAPMRGEGEEAAVGRGGGGAAGGQGDKLHRGVVGHLRWVGPGGSKGRPCGFPPGGSVGQGQCGPWGRGGPGGGAGRRRLVGAGRSTRTQQRPPH